MVDWALARSTATRLVKPGPAISADGALAAVAELREAAARAEELRHPGDRAGRRLGQRARARRRPAGLDPGQPRRLPDAADPADRPGRGTSSRRAPARSGLGSRVTGAEVGVLLSYLAPKVLGQFDPFWTGPDGARGPAPAGRAERRRDRARAARPVERLPAVGVPARGDPPRAVHGRALAARPPARPRSAASSRPPTSTTGSVGQVAASTAVRRIVEAHPRGRGAVGRRPRADPGAARDRRRDHRGDVPARGPRRRGHGQRRARGRARASRRSGRRFDVRRQGQGPDKIVRRLLGLDAKMRQYRDGAAFCRHVLDEVGMDRAQPGLDLAGHPAQPRRDRQPAALGDPQPPRARHPVRRLSPARTCPGGPSVRRRSPSCRRSPRPSSRPTAPCSSPARAGADSLALAAGVAHVARDAGLP